MEAWSFLVFARIITALLPFKRILHIVKAEKKEGSHNINEYSRELLNDISLAIRRSSTRSFCRTKCLEQAIAGKIMLNRRGIKCNIYLGVASKDISKKELLAHAWLKSGEQTVTGGKDISEFKIVSSI